MKMRDNFYNINNIAKINSKFAFEIHTKNENKAWINQEMRDDIFELFQNIRLAFDVMLNNISFDSKKIDLATSKSLMQKISYHKEQIELKLKQKKYIADVPSVAIMHYKNIMNLCDEISQEIYNISYTKIINNR